jgi:hypothetical protein
MRNKSSNFQTQPSFTKHDLIGPIMPDPERNQPTLSMTDFAYRLEKPNQIYTFFKALQHSMCMEVQAYD